MPIQIPKSRGWQCPQLPLFSLSFLTDHDQDSPGPAWRTEELPRDIPALPGPLFPTHHLQLAGEGHQLLRRGRPEVQPAGPGGHAQLPAGEGGVVRPVGAVRLLADLDVKEILILAALGAGLVAGVLREAEAQQPVRVAVELFEVRGLAELVLGRAAVLAVEAVAGDEAADAAHAAPGADTGPASAARS